MISTSSATLLSQDHELVAMAKQAWKNSARCIGRLHWDSLIAYDARDAATPSEVFAACVDHLRHSTNGGRIRSAVTFFREAKPGNEIRIWNDQLIRYAGYGQADGSVLGDPAQVAFTQRVMDMGWQPPEVRGMFDRLPLVIGVPGHKPELFELPQDAVLEVAIQHPDYGWLGEMGLKWHALPALSNMALVAEGVRFSAAPFSGFYMVTEIATRNFGDEQRYHLLPRIADAMGLERTSSLSYWKDRALVELNAAVLWSFRQAGVTIVDHHTASRQFMTYVQTEESQGRKVPGDWSWLVPPMSGSACPVFHRYYDVSRPLPAFVEQDRAW
jgi:nitric-oxide synthase, bacterial